MSFYSRIAKKNIGIPYVLDMKVGQVVSIAQESSDRLDAVYNAFRFGYLQGRRAVEKERKGDFVA